MNNINNIMNFDKSYINIVQGLHETSNPLEVLYFYRSNIDFMKKNNVKIIISDDNIHNASIFFDDLFAGHEKYLKSALIGNNFIFYSPKIIASYEITRKIPISIDRSIAIDTNVASIIGRYLDGKKIDSEQSEILQLLLNVVSKEKITLDFLPYLIENLCKNNVGVESILRNTNSIIEFFNLSIESSSEAHNFILKYKNDPNFKNDILKRFSLFYLILLKIIHFNKKLGSEEHKVKALVDFMDNKIFLMFKRELIIGVEYFKKVKKLKFFNKVNTKDINELLKTISNMAWDLTLCRIVLEHNFTILPDKGADFFVPFFLTFDKGLSEIIDLYPLKAILYFGNDNYSMQAIPAIDVDNAILKRYGLETYFMEEAINKREKIYKRLGNKYLSHICNLIEIAEREIQEI